VRLYLDSNAIIQAYEGAPPLQGVVVARIAEVCMTPGGVVMTSILARLEVRTKPLLTHNLGLLSHYDYLFHQSGLLVIGVTESIIERATALRANHSFRTPDAIHLATALEAGADVFLTGDKALAKCPGLIVEIF
jgi:predicted nucleic acid-binding protein